MQFLPMLCVLCSELGGKLVVVGVSTCSQAILFLHSLGRMNMILTSSGAFAVNSV